MDPVRSAALKRALDVALSGAGLVVAAAPMAVIAAAVRVTMGRPVLFRQTRPGSGGQPFTLLKFRTMRDDESAGNDAERLTRLGRWLRSTSLDELPELVNVLVGDMSLVGPRPLLMEYLDLYSDEQGRRHEVRPGLTGWAQVAGRNAVGWDERLTLDVWYVDNHTLGLDLRILARTIASVIRREGISAPGHPTMERFRGSAE